MLNRVEVEVEGEEREVEASGFGCHSSRVEGGGVRRIESGSGIGECSGRPTSGYRFEYREEYR